MLTTTPSKLLPALAAVFATCAVHAGDLKLEISLPTAREGAVMVAVFNKADSFPRGTPLRTAMIDPTQGKATLQFNGLPTGDYAVTAFLDENRNSKLDSNLFGIPTELYGFSRNARGLAGPPTFVDAAFRVDDSARLQAFELK